jgi:hypothetical protein
MALIRGVIRPAMVFLSRVIGFTVDSLRRGNVAIPAPASVTTRQHHGAGHRAGFCRRHRWWPVVLRQREFSADAAFFR